MFFKLVFWSPHQKRKSILLNALLEGEPKSLGKQKFAFGTKSWVEFGLLRLKEWDMVLQTKVVCPLSKESGFGGDSDVFLTKNRKKSKMFLEVFLGAS